MYELNPVVFVGFRFWVKFTEIWEVICSFLLQTIIKADIIVLVSVLNKAYIRKYLLTLM